MGTWFSTSVSTEYLALGILSLLVIIQFIMLFVTKSKVKKLKVKYDKFMNGNGDQKVGEVLEQCIDKINLLETKNKEIEQHMNSIDRDILQCIQKTAVVRYNAFENVGSDLSFAIALLDTNDSGVVISGIYARDSSSTYAKPIVSGKSKYALSAEEIQAIDQAKKTYREKSYL